MLRTVDLAVGIIFVFLLVSTLCSAAREGIEAILKTRAAYLERGIRELLNDVDGSGLAKTLFEHPLLFGLSIEKYVPRPLAKSLCVLANGRGRPSYVPAKTFALALLDIAARGPTTDEVSSDPSSEPLTVQSIRDRVLNIANPGVRRVLLTALDTSWGDLELARQALEDWFNASMDRVAGWYKRSTQWVVLVIAVVLTVGINIDTLALADYLYHDDAARAAVVASAEATVKNKTQPTAQDAAAKLEALELPLGWRETRMPTNALGWLNRALGWSITALAAMLGAPFWFDVLSKVMVIRSTVKPREKSPDESSEDLRPNKPRPAQPSAGLLSGAAPTLGLSQTLQPLRATNRPPLPREPDKERDACEIVVETPTADDDLPAATGGVA